MTNANFRRKETKYMISAQQRQIIENGIIEHGMKLTRFGEDTVNSIYFDTATYDIISRSLEKPLYKEKIRLRWYGACQIEEASNVFIELKKKFKGIVYKRRAKVSPQQIENFLENKDIEELVAVSEDTNYIERQIKNEICSAIKRHDRLSISTLIRYERTPYEDGNESGLRITFDSNIRGIETSVNTKDGQERFQQIDKEVNLLDNGYSIMEIKCIGAYPLWLVELLNQAKAYPHSFSKYGTFYTQLMSSL